MSAPAAGAGPGSHDRPSILAPPPLLAVLSIAAGMLANHYIPLPFLRADWAIARIAASAALFVLSFGLGFSALRELHIHRTSPNPYRASTAVVSSGVFAFTRNPIYVSFLLAVLAFAVAVNSAWSLAALLLLFVLLDLGVVRREERYLAAKFGEAYDSYRRRARRWL